MAKKSKKPEVGTDLEKVVLETVKLNNTPDTAVIKFKLTDPDARMPEYAHEGDAGMDVYACGVEYDEEHDTYIYHTGVSYESEPGIVSYGVARSSNCYTDSYLTNGVGVIDCATFRGSIQYRYKNRTDIMTRAKENALVEMATLPWWKKLFKTSDELRVMYEQYLAKWYEWHVSHALAYAPYEPGDKVGQIIFSRFVTANAQEVDELSPSTRGRGGFGSTGLPKNSKKKISILFNI